MLKVNVANICLQCSESHTLKAGDSEAIIRISNLSAKLAGWYEEESAQHKAGPKQICEFCISKQNINTSGREHGSVLFGDGLML